MNDTLVKDTVSTVLTLLDLPFGEIAVTEADGFIRVDIASPKASRIIGWHGETLNSVQHVVKAIVRSQEKLDKSPFIVLDVDGYRRDQEEKVRKITEQKADFVRRTGNRVALAPMSPYFRRVAHLHVSESKDLQDITTESVGEGDYRQVVIRLKDEKKKSGDGEELSPVMEESGDDGLGNLDI